MKGDRLGEFEELLLLAVQAVRVDAYGVPIQRYLERATGRRLSMGAVYAALDRLEEKGFLRSGFAQPTAERGGKRKRVFAATPAGLNAARAVRGVREKIWRAIEQER